MSECMGECMSEYMGECMSKPIGHGVRSALT